MNPVRLVARLAFLIVLVVVAGAAWVGIRGWLATDHLESSADLLGRLQIQLEEGSTAPAQVTVTRVQRETASAQALTGDVVWRFATHLPKIGDDLSAVHAVALSAHTAAEQALPPIAAAAGDVHKLRNTGGDLSPARLVIVAKRLKTPLATAQQGIDLARSQIATVDPTTLLGPVRDGVTQLSSGLRTIDGEVSALALIDRTVLAAAPSGG